MPQGGKGVQVVILLPDPHEIDVLGFFPMLSEVTCNFQQYGKK